MSQLLYTVFFYLCPSRRAYVGALHAIRFDGCVDRRPTHERGDSRGRPNSIIPFPVARSSTLIPHVVAGVSAADSCVPLR